MRILIIEDEQSLGDALAEILKQNHYTADTVSNGLEGLDFACSGIYDLILLDIMLPGLDGLSLLKALRSKQISTPVILLTAKSGLPDVIAGLDAGSDDYLTKPFSTGELLARIRALLRRSSVTTYCGNVLSYGDLSFNKGTMELCCKNDSLKLGLKEAQLIELLLVNSGQIISKNILTEKIWGLESNTEYNNIEVYISFLRQKLQSLETNVHIKTIRGAGYQLEEQII